MSDEFRNCCGKKMKCTDSRMGGTRVGKPWVRRRYICKVCDRRFTTREYRMEDLEHMEKIMEKYEQITQIINKYYGH